MPKMESLGTTRDSTASPVVYLPLEAEMLPSKYRLLQCFNCIAQFTPTPHRDKNLMIS